MFQSLWFPRFCPELYKNLTTWKSTYLESCVKFSEPNLENYDNQGSFKKIYNIGCWYFFKYLKNHQQIFLGKNINQTNILKFIGTIFTSMEEIILS